MITCVHTLRCTHTHSFVMEWSFMAALKIVPTQRSDLCYGKLPLSSVSASSSTSSSSSACSFTHSSLFPSNQLSASHHLLLPLLSLSCFHPAGMQLYFTFNTSVFSSPLSFSCTLLPPPSSPRCRLSFWHFIFITSYFFISVQSISSLFLPQMSFCCKYLIWLKSTFLFTLFQYQPLLHSCTHEWLRLFLLIFLPTLPKL